jgi:hypothetical protein
MNACAVHACGSHLLRCVHPRLNPRTRAITQSINKQRHHPPCLSDISLTSRHIGAYRACQAALGLDEIDQALREDGSVTLLVDRSEDRSPFAIKRALAKLGQLGIDLEWTDSFSLRQLDHSAVEGRGVVGEITTVQLNFRGPARPFTRS